MCVHFWLRHNWDVRHSFRVLQHGQDLCHGVPKERTRPEGKGGFVYECVSVYSGITFFINEQWFLITGRVPVHLDSEKPAEISCRLLAGLPSWDCHLQRSIGGEKCGLQGQVCHGTGFVLAPDPALDGPPLIGIPICGVDTLYEPIKCKKKKKKACERSVV